MAAVIGGKALALTLAALALLACERPRAKKGLGRVLAPGKAQGLLASPDGSRLAWLTRCARSPVPQAAPTCDLVALPTEGGAPVRLASGVSSREGGFAFGPDGALAALADVDAAAGTGTLVLSRPGSAPERLAPFVTFFGFGNRGELGFVSAGDLYVVPPGEGALRVEGTGAVATFEFDPKAPSELLARRQAAAGGQLVRVSGGAARLESRAAAGEYAWSPDGRFVAATVRGAGGTWDLVLHSADGKAPPSTLAADVQAFAFARDGSALAFLAGMSPGRPGDLYAASLGPGAAPASVRASVLARGVGEFRFSGGAAHLAWLESFDPRVRAGALGVGSPGGRASVFGKNVTAFDVSPGADRVAFLEHITSGGYSVDLRLAPFGAEGVGTVARGVFGFEFSPDGRWLYYRANCVRNAEACDLFRVPAKGLSAGEPALRVAEAVKSFEFDRARPDRLLVGFARKDLPALDLALFDGSGLLGVDEAVSPGSARFLPPDGSRLAYVVAAPERAGVYLAPLP